MNWKTTAIKSFPEDKLSINNCENPYEFWIDMYEDYIISLNKNELEKPKRLVKLALSCITNEEKIASDMGQAALISFFHQIAKNIELWKYIPIFFNEKELNLLSGEFEFALGFIKYNKFRNEIIKNT